MVAAKPDCTGQKFGMLTVLGKGDRILYPKKGRNPSYRFLHRLQCDCGEIIQLARGDFDRKKGGQISCGCARKRGLVDNKRRTLDISGQKFGSLTAIALTGKKDKWNKPTWTLQCDCGKLCELSLTLLRTQEKSKLWINCGDRVSHPEKYLHYPPVPNPLPLEAGKLLIKYLPLTKLYFKRVKSAVEDEKVDRLIRACWIVVYRRSQGEIISELYEERLIKKHLRFCSVDVYLKDKLEKNGGILYYKENSLIGNKMTIDNFENYPVLETSGIKILSIKKRVVSPPIKRASRKRSKLFYN